MKVFIPHVCITHNKQHKKNTQVSGERQIMDVYNYCDI